MISVIVLFHNARLQAEQCLRSITWSFDQLHLPTPIEFVLVDDCSDPVHEIPQFLLDFRKQVRAEVSITRFRRHKHYAYGLSYAMSRARGRQLLFFSHDMVIPPACVKTLLALAGMNDSLGIIRPVSRHMDMTHELQIPEPLPIRTLGDLELFASVVAKRNGLLAIENQILIGDAMLVQRGVLDKIGVPDPRFFGFMADIDFGLRAVRAGFHVVSAPGAWLHHEGAASQHSGTPEQAKATADRNLADTIAAMQFFKEKWKCTHIEGKVDEKDWHWLKQAKLEVEEYAPPMAVDPDICEVL